VSELLAEWMRLEERYRANSYNGSGASDEIHVSCEARGLLLVAGHSVAQTRSGRRKKPDLRTGGLAELVGAHAGVSVLTAVGSGSGDPNRDEEHPLKLALRELAPTHAVVIDLHGMSDEHELDLCVGSGNAVQQSGLAARCVRGAEEAGLEVSLDEPFPARRRATLTSTAQRLGCDAIQLEIAARRRDPAVRGDEALVLVRWLLDFVAAVAPRPAAR
jgi:hypothetical protein